MRLPIMLTAALSSLALLAACQPPAETADKTAAAVEAPVMPADAPPQEDAVLPAEAASTSCILDQGSDAAMDLVQRCMAVSPASHPPCNPNNPCQLIQDEIDRACALWEKRGDVPAECRA